MGTGALVSVVERRSRYTVLVAAATIALLGIAYAPNGIMPSVGRGCILPVAPIRPKALESPGTLSPNSTAATRSKQFLISPKQPT